MNITLEKVDGANALTSADLAEITAGADQIDLSGDRYPAAMQQWINR